MRWAQELQTRWLQDPIELSERHYDEPAGALSEHTNGNPGHPKLWDPEAERELKSLVVPMFVKSHHPSRRRR